MRWERLGFSNWAREHSVIAAMADCMRLCEVLELSTDGPSRLDFKYGEDSR